jgi:hypothetical protein
LDSNTLILNRFFSKKTICDLINGNDSPTYSAVVRQYLGDPTHLINRAAIQGIYETMRKSHRNEYYYKNTLLNKLLLGRHSLNTTTALTEVQVDGSKADFVLINGKAVVYEIKTELDTLDRLEGQVRDYFKAFSNVCVLTSESHYERVTGLLDCVPNVGIYVLTERSTISLKRDPIEDMSKLEHKSMFKILRKAEFESVLLQYYKELPQCKPAHYYKECYCMFEQISLENAYEAFLRELKSRNKISTADFLQYVPFELRFLVYFSSFKTRDYLKLDGFLEGTLGG